MKVMMIDHFLPGSIYTLELGRQMKQYCDLTVCCKDTVHMSEDGINWQPVIYHGGKKGVMALYAYAKSLRTVKRMLQDGQFDVLHIQSFKKEQVEIPFYIRLKPYVKKLVYTVHNVLPHEKSAKWHKLYDRFYSVCDELMVHNETSKEILIERFHVPEEKIHVIAHGVYQTQLDRLEDQPKQKTASSGITRFAMLGFVRQYKGIDLLVDAVKLLPERERDNMEFLIMGKQFESQDNTDYRGMIKAKRLDDIITFKEGHVPEEELPTIFANTDFVVFPYRHIYGSGVLLMAYTFNTPVIVSDLPAFIEETCNGATGYTFKTGSAVSLANALLEAAHASNECISIKKMQIRQLVEEKYNWKISAKKVVDMYNR